MMPLMPLLASILTRAWRLRSPDFYSKMLCHSLLCFLVLKASSTYGQSATQVVITTQPVLSATNGGLMSVQPVVEIRDAGNLLVSTSTAQVEIAIASGTGGVLGGTTRITAVNGIASFTDLTFTGVVGQTYTFQFKSEPVIANEPFAYAGGTSLTGQGGGTGWSTNLWYGPNGAFTDLSVNSTGLTYTGFTTSGGRASYIASTGGDAGRRLAAASNASYNVIWLAFLGNYTQQGGGFNNMRLMNSPSTLTGAIGGNDNYTHWSILNNSLTSTTFTSTPLDGSTRLALLKIDYSAGTSSLWMDPVIAGFDGSQSPSMTASFAPVFNEIQLFNRSTGVSTDEITLASTYKAALHLENNLTPAVSSDLTVLPVKWIYFTATANSTHTLLKWGAGTETNNSHFIVERSRNGHVWTSIAKVQGAGNSGIDQHYQFTDSAFSGRTYYRLNQVDLDGRSHWSKIVPVDGEIKKPLHVFPNPTRSLLQFTGAQPGSPYQLVNAQGRVVRTGVVREGITGVLLRGLADGGYYLRVMGAVVQSVQVVKEND